jgi:hypothetical protein
MEGIMKAVKYDKNLVKFVMVNNFCVKFQFGNSNSEVQREHKEIKSEVKSTGTKHGLKK